MTKSTVVVAMKRARDEQKRVIINDRDAGGLRLIVQPTGKASWVFDYRPRGRRPDGSRWPQKRIVIGGPETLTPAAARQEAARLRSAVADGKDPAGEKAAARQAEVDRRTKEKTLGELAEIYARKIDDGSKYRGEEISRVRRALAMMGRTDSLDISKGDVLFMLDAMKEKPGARFHFYGALSRFLDWAVDREALPINVAAKIRKQDRPKPPASRTVTPSLVDIRAVWDGVDALTDVQRDFTRFMLLTPLRLQEGANLSAAEVDLSAGAIRIEAMRMKNGEAFSIPLLGAAREIVEARLGEGRVFQLAGGGREMTAWTKYRKRVAVVAGLEAFRPHDLRRTFVSALAELGFDLDLLDSLIAHRQSASRGGVAGVYQRSSRWSAKIGAMQAWDRLVTRADNNVLALAK